MKKNFKTILTLLILTLLFASVFSACEINGGQDSSSTSSSNQSSSQSQSESSSLEANFSLTFFVDGEEIHKISGKANETVTAIPTPEKDGFVFDGWYSSPDFNGEKANVPTQFPAENLEFYGRFVKEVKRSAVHYDVNLLDVSYEGDVESHGGEVGTSLTVKDGKDFLVEGYLFLGWTTDPEMVYTFTDAKPDYQYEVGDEIVLGEEDVTLYGHWATEFKDYNEKSSDKVYMYEPLIGKGQGAAILEREGKALKYGFISIDSNQNAEFTFYFSEEEGGDIVGRLYGDKTYAFRDDTVGMFLEYNHALNQEGFRIFASDGYGLASITTFVGEQLKTEFAGFYDFDERYDDFGLYGVDQNGETYLYANFILVNDEKISGENFKGYYLEQGYESGSYMAYDNGELTSLRLDLNGYGSAKWYSYDPVLEESTLLGEGSYDGTDRYEDYMGEWIFTDKNESGETFKFVLSTVSVGGEIIPVYIEYDQTLDLTLNASDGNGTLTLNGYGVGVYSVASETFVGVYSVGETLITFIPYLEDGNGNVTAGGAIHFNADFEAKTYEVNSDGFVIDNGVLISYTGSSSIVSIPEGVTEIADDAFNYNHTEVSLVSVTVPASVTKIGARAFQNDYTLSTVIFLSETPISIDFTASVNPFRWPAGNFTIIVPEGSQTAYKTAWKDCTYAIKGSEEVKILPEFEIENGVLKRYNKPEDSGERIELVIPEDVTEIADGVFKGLNFIISVDLNFVSKIGASAFELCENLERVDFALVKEIGVGAFAGCINLGKKDGTIAIPYVETVGASAFSGCEKLKLVRFGSNLSSLGENAFMECHIYDDGKPLFLEFSGTTPPQMGASVGLGCISIKFKAPSINFVLACYEEPTWNKYLKSLYVESGEEKGLYMDGVITLSLDGRAVYDHLHIWMYQIDGEKITFYEHDEETATVYAVTGSFRNGTITVEIGGLTYNFVKADGQTVTFTSEDGLYQIECDPKVFDQETYKDTDYKGDATILLNGEKATLTVHGNSWTIKGFKETDGSSDFTLYMGKGLTFTYKKTMTPTYIRNITAEDGSTLNIHFTSSAIYVFGQIKIEVDGAVMTSFSDWSVVATNPSPNVYVFIRMWLNDKYEVTATVSEDLTTFTYTYVKL